MKYRKYQKLRRLGTSEVQDILEGKCYIFPKIDGTNASVWIDGDCIMAGSRTRQLTLENDNAGFYNAISKDARFEKFLCKYPNLRLYGEWLVPHSLRTYRDTAWREFYVFDVVKEDGEDSFTYLTYEQYKPLLEEFGIEYIPPLAIINNPTVESISNQLEKNGFLIEDGKGNGEGVVVKNYEFTNRYGNVVWAKVVTNEFKEKNHKIFGAPEINTKVGIEEKIVEDFCTESFVEKEFSKFVLLKDGWQMKYVNEFIGRLFKELLEEEIHNILKAHKNPTINFRTLQGLVTRKFKLVKADLF